MNIVLKFLLFFLLYSQTTFAVNKQDSNPNKLDIAFCLDLSGSTNGLIEDLRNNLWYIINQANQLQPQPDLQIAVVGFSRPSFKKENGYVKVICDLTNDFDLISYELYKLRPSIEKGDQFVGAALNTCVTKLNWREGIGGKKIIYMVGNGMVATNNNDYIKSCELAVQQTILVNAIYVIGKKSNKAAELPGWYKLANLTHGMTSEITVGKQETINSYAVSIDKLAEATRNLNLTYIYHGKYGYNHYMFFRKADSASFMNGQSSFFERVYYKNSSLFKYKNDEWDMIDYVTKNGYLPNLSDSMLMPDTLRNKSPDDIYNLILEQKAARQRFNSVINQLVNIEDPKSLHQRFISGELKDENIFTRCVLNILAKQWK